MKSYTFAVYGPGVPGGQMPGMRLMKFPASKSKLTRALADVQEAASVFGVPGSVTVADALAEPVLLHGAVAVNSEGMLAPSAPPGSYPEALAQLNNVLAQTVASGDKAAIRRMLEGMQGLSQTIRDALD